jgi:DNA-binding XRE family transcriptional regulator
MIKDDHEYQVTKSWISKFQQAIITLGQNEEKKSKDPEGWQLQIDSYFAHIKHLLNELVEYESLINHSPETSLFVQNNNVNLDEIGDTLIKVRIAKKISQKELARLANLTEDEVVDYETKDYKNASFGTMIEVAEALGIKFQQYTIVSQINDSLSKELLQIRQSGNCCEKVQVIQ